MAFSLHRLRVRDLLVGWVGYWAALLAVALGPAVAPIWRATHLPAGQGTITGGLGNGILTLTAGTKATVFWEGKTSVIGAVLWIAGPPLLLWLLWLRQAARRREHVSSAREVPALEAPSIGGDGLMRGTPLRDREPSARHDDR